MNHRSAVLVAALSGAWAAGCTERPGDNDVQSGDGAAITVSPVREEREMRGQAVQTSAGGVAADMAAAGPAGMAVLQLPSSDTAVSMIIRTGNARIRVEDVQRAVVALREIAGRLGGYVANTSYQGGRDQVRSASLEIKVPARSYDQAAADLTRVGEVESLNTTAEDVGEEYVDLGARAGNSRRLEQRLVELLATHTGRLQDVLAVERELARVREEIERIEGRMRYLRSRAAMSTLTVTVHEPEPLHGFEPGDNPLVGALKKAWRNFVGFIAALIAATGVLVPLAALAAAGWFGYRRIRAR